MTKETYRNPLLDKVKLPMFNTGLFIRGGIVAALLGGAAWAGRDVLFSSDESVEAPIADLQTRESN